MDLDRKPCFLQALPQELLLMICQEVVGTDNKRDTAALACMARTCRIFNDVATAILYRDIHRARDATNPTDYINELSSFCKDVRLVATLHNNQALGPIIRTMELAPANLYIVLGGYLPTAITKDVRLAIAQMFGDDPEVPNSFGLVPYMALVGSAPRLAKLTLSLYFNWKDTDFLLHKHNGLMKGTRITLPYLTDLKIHSPAGRHSDTNWGVDIQSVNGLLHCTPRLEKLAIEYAKGGTSLTARLEHLTTLKLTKTQLCARGLANLTRACHNLVEFD
jgi:hypothetical protein